MQPDDQAAVEMVANVGDYYFSTSTNQEGRYTFAETPPDVQFWLVARSPIGTSNPAEVTVRAGETRTVDLQTFIGFPLLMARPAGGRILLGGQAVAGAAVWPLDGSQVVITNEAGFFSFYYIADTPVMAVSGDRWAVVTLEPGVVIDVPLTQTGPHPAPPGGPVVTSIPIEDIVISEPRLITRGLILVPTRPLLEIVTPIPVRPTATPGRLLVPSRPLLEIVTPVPLRPTLQQ
jgi:hypothetical protein